MFHVNLLSKCQLSAIYLTSDLLAMHANSAACGIYWWHDITIRVWHDNASIETTANAFRRLVYRPLRPLDHVSIPQCNARLVCFGI